MPIQDEPSESQSGTEQHQTEEAPPDPATTLGGASTEPEERGIGPNDPTVDAPAEPDSPPTEPAPDQTIEHRGADRERLLGGRFKLLRLLARQGNLGEVYEADDLELGRKVVVKLIGSRIATDPDAQARFLREAAITSQLDHSGVAPVFGYGVTPEGRLWYAMRFVYGQTLADAIAAFHRSHPATARLSPAGVIAFQSMLRRFLSVCGTIAYAHGRGVIHRDIKPGNIMFGAREGDTVVLDWGLGKPLDAPLISVGPWSGSGSGSGSGPGADSGAPSGGPLGGSSGSTETVAGAQVGTLRYMAPQQVAREPADYASDIYSLGATLYQVVAGSPPFSEYMAQEVEEYIRRGEFRPPRALRPSLDPELEAIVLKAMRYEPADRYATAAELADDLERWLADEPILAGKATRITRARRWVRRHRTLAAAGLVLTLCLAGASLPLAVFYQRAVASEQNTRSLLDEFLEVMVDDLPRLPGNEQILRRLVLASQEPVDRFVEQDPNSAEIRQQAARVSALAARVVVRHERVDIPGRAGGTLPGPDPLFARAIEHHAHLLNQDGTDHDAIAGELARLEVQRAACAWAAGGVEESLRAWPALDARLKGLASHYPGAVEIPRARGLALSARARFLELAGDPPGATTAAEEAIGLLDGSKVAEDRFAQINARLLLGRLAAQAGEYPQALVRVGEARKQVSNWRSEEPNQPLAEAASCQATLTEIELCSWNQFPGIAPPSKLLEKLHPLGVRIQDLRNDFVETSAFPRLAADYALLYPRWFPDPAEGSGVTPPDDVLDLYMAEARERLAGPLPNQDDRNRLVRLLALREARRRAAGEADEAERFRQEALRLISEAEQADPLRFRGLRELHDRESKIARFNLPPSAPSSAR
jgi:serine/threonine protein kinase